jgi:hypothetical protein
VFWNNMILDTLNSYYSYENRIQVEKRGQRPYEYAQTTGRYHTLTLVVWGVNGLEPAAPTIYSLHFILLNETFASSGSSFNAMFFEVESIKSMVAHSVRKAC